MQEEKSDKKQAADSFAEMFRAFGQAMSEVFNDPKLKDKAKELARTQEGRIDKERAAKLAEIIKSFEGAKE